MAAGPVNADSIRAFLIALDSFCRMLIVVEVGGAVFDVSVSVGCWCALRFFCFSGISAGCISIRFGRRNLEIFGRPCVDSGESSWQLGVKFSFLGVSVLLLGDTRVREAEEEIDCEAVVVLLGTLNCCPLAPSGVVSLLRCSDKGAETASRNACASAASGEDWGLA